MGHYRGRDRRKKREARRRREGRRLAALRRVPRAVADYALYRTLLDRDRRDLKPVLDRLLAVWWLEAQADGLVPAGAPMPELTWAWPEAALPADLVGTTDAANYSSALLGFPTPGRPPGIPLGPSGRRPRD
jgi:hypothetical protein